MHHFFGCIWDLANEINYAKRISTQLNQSQKCSHSVMNNNQTIFKLGTYLLHTILMSQFNFPICGYWLFTLSFSFLGLTGKYA